MKSCEIDIPPLPDYVSERDGEYRMSADWNFTFYDPYRILGNVYPSKFEDVEFPRFIQKIRSVLGKEDKTKERKLWTVMTDIVHLYQPIDVAKELRAKVLDKRGEMLNAEELEEFAKKTLEPYVDRVRRIRAMFENECCEIDAEKNI